MNGGGAMAQTTLRVRSCSPVLRSTALSRSLRPWLSRPDVAAFVSLGGAAFDLAIGPLLLLRATRPLALLLLTPAFHVTNHMLWSLGESGHAHVLRTSLCVPDGVPLCA